jgi:hypothetical protein
MKEWIDEFMLTEEKYRGWFVGLRNGVRGITWFITALSRRAPVLVVHFVIALSMQALGFVIRWSFRIVTARLRGFAR